MTRSVCIIQARLGSKRFPNKILADIAGHPMIWHVVDRAQRIRGLDDVCIATVPADATALEGFGVRVYAPAIDENDVLARYSWVKTRLGAHLVIRITGDCPLLDPDEATAMINHMKRPSSSDYISNRSPNNDGLDVEVMTARALHRADDEANDPYDREHVTPYIYNHPDLFEVATYWGRSLAEKWSVDTPEDLELVRQRMMEGA